MREYYENAMEEFKRADHLMYVSLKYTRTCDVFKSIIERLIDTFDDVMEGLLEKAKEDAKIFDIPPSPKLRTEEIKRIYSEDEIIVDMTNFYLLLRRLDRADFTRKSEFRRHVTMTCAMDNGEIHEITIDKIEEYFIKSKDILQYFKEKYTE
ncbi:MAG: hypothetical protein ABIC95_05680 [archaeon]